MLLLAAWKHNKACRNGRACRLGHQSFVYVPVTKALTEPQNALICTQKAAQMRGRKHASQSADYRSKLGQQ